MYWKGLLCRSSLRPAFPCMTLAHWAIALLLFATVACTPSIKSSAFQPVNTGREYGDPVPLMVTHIGKGDHPHYILQNIICFNYKCRKQVGKKKAMRRISFADFKKRIEKNAKQGKYKNLTPPRPKPTIKKDTVKIPKDTVVIAPVLSPAVTTEIPAAPVLKADSLITLGDLLFELNSAKLHDQHITALESLGAWLKAHPTIQVSVTGHTDSTGTERHNVSLSTRRAQVVSEYLIKQGVDFNRITFEGFGSSQPLVSNRTEAGRKKNRRVEILLKK